MQAQEAQQLAVDILSDLAAFSERASGPVWPDRLWPVMESDDSLDASARESAS